MKYDLKIGDEVQTLEWRAEKGSEQARVMTTGGERALHFQVVDEHQYRLTMDGRSVRVFAAAGGDGTQVFIEGRTYRVQALDVTRRRKQRSASGETSGEVTPPMPAVVVRILVREGETVRRGQGLLVVSAMKMETTLTAPLDGVVKKINVGLQNKVMPGDRLVEIESGG